MEPAHFRFGGGLPASFFNPVVAVALLVTIILVLWLPRKHAIVPLLLAILLIPKGQVLVAAGLHLFAYRLILLAVLARWFMLRRTFRLEGDFNSIDKVFMLWAISEFIVFNLQWMDPQALIKATGDLLDALGGYFALRFLISDRDEVRRAIQVFALVAVIAGASMILEQRTGTNLFGFLGGVSLHPEMRNGSVRSQGPFQHAILAGSYGATLVPLLVWLWSDGKSRKLALLGAIGATAMTITPHSSSTLGCYAASIFGLCMWPLRKRMREIRWGLAATLVGLQLVMKGPVWSLMEHINLTGSSESYHRYQLIDTFIRHFGDWWLLGTRSNDSWGWEMHDTSNQYVTWGISGGLTTFVLFIALIARAFGKIGDARKLAQKNHADEWFVWCLGAAMFAHIVVYFGIDYFDEMEFVWFTLLAIISTTDYSSKTYSLKRPAVPFVDKTTFENAALSWKGVATTTAASFQPRSDSRDIL